MISTRARMRKHPIRFSCILRPEVMCSLTTPCPILASVGTSHNRTLLGLPLG